MKRSRSSETLQQEVDVYELMIDRLQESRVFMGDFDICRHCKGRAMWLSDDVRYCSCDRELPCIDGCADYRNAVVRECTNMECSNEVCDRCERECDRCSATICKQCAENVMHDLCRRCEKKMARESMVSSSSSSSSSESE